MVCGVSHTECRYECIEYYPNGVDCKKTKKVCYTVCDDYDVEPSGPTAKLDFSLHMLDKEETRKIVKAKGILIRVNLEGNETTGWALYPDVEDKIEKNMKCIEVEPRRTNLNSYEDKNITIEGILEWGYGTERGHYPVIEILSIQNTSS